MMNKPNASLLYSALAVTAIVGSFFSPFVSVATGQPTENNLMDLITRYGGSNETDDENMMMMGEGMMGSESASMPFNMGVFIMPMTCTSPNELLGSMFGMFGSADGDAASDGTGGDNATQSMMMDMMRQQMMMAGGGDMNGMNGMMGMGDNRTEADMEHIMSMNICFPMMGEKMADGMMGMMGQ